MAAKIDKDGLLEIKRAGKWKKAFCPFQLQEHPRHIQMYNHT